MNAFQILWEYRAAFLSGIVVTFELVVVSVVLGTIFGVALQLINWKNEDASAKVISGTAFGISAIPALVILFWLYYPAQTLLGINLSPFVTAALALTLMNSFAVYRIVADAVKDFPKQYIASAQVCGLSELQTLRYIQFPLLLRSSLPRWIDQQVVILQTSVFASLISVNEVFREAQLINSVVYQPVVIYTSMALIFFVTAGSALYVAKYFREKYHRDFSER